MRRSFSAASPSGVSAGNGGRFGTAGIAFVPENRRMMLFRSEPVFKNVSIAILDRIHRLMVKPKEEKRITEAHIKDLQIRPPRTA